MLQQTQVQTVLERFYHPFLTRFPTLTALANATEEDVLKQWQGLGYYTRARNLHHTAQRSAPALPHTVEELIALPGIGRNTAHAIASFAYGVPVPVMEANVRRVLCRMFALTNPTEKTLWQHAEKILNTQDPFTHNQAMMDLGAMVCTVRAPHCDVCPLSRHCAGRNTPEQFPQKKKKSTVPIRKKSLIAFQREDGKIFLQPRSSRFLNGLYGLPEIASAETTIPFGSSTFPLKKMHHAGNIEQKYSHFTLKAEIYRQLLDDTPKPNDGDWYNHAEIAALPLSRADEKALALLKIRLATNRE